MVATAPALAVAAALALATAPAGAEGEEIIIRPTMVIYDSPGSVHTVADMPVPASLQGMPCDLRVVTQNQASVHPGTDVVVTTGGATSTIEGVEDSADARVVDTHRVTLGPDILIEVTIGPDGSTSLGFTVSFECTPEQLLPTVAPAQQTTTTVAGAPSTGPTVSAPLTGETTPATPAVGGVTTSSTGEPVVGGETTSSTGGPAVGGETTSSTTAGPPAPAGVVQGTPSVLGAQQVPGPLPQAPSALATTASPSFTG
ncbi:MAG: hypothetical protein R2761_20500 [Acidimicrobiales bacterium]